MENNKKKKCIKWHINGNYERRKRKKLNSLKEKKKIKYSPVEAKKSDGKKSRRVEGREE